MRRGVAILVAAAGCFVPPPGIATAADPAEHAVPDGGGGDLEAITLRVRFLIPRDVVVEVRGRKLDTWITPADLREEVLPEVNRIWRQAGIRFEEESILEVPAVRRDGHADLLEEIAAGGRDERGRSDPTLLEKIRRFFPPDKLDPGSQNVLLFPYIGKTLQGNAVIGGNLAVVGLWTDKDSRGRELPHRVALREPEPFAKGSLGRTIAHELGHGLGLHHPDKDDPLVHRLMGGRSPGYVLTPGEIEIARDEARRHADGIFSGARQDRR